MTVLYFEGCPNWELARDRAVEALQIVGADANVELRRVETPEEAERIGFAGSPTILIDGHDPFPSDSTGFACRLYGTDHSPTVAELVETLERSR